LILKELKIYGDVNSKFLGELANFLQTKDDWYKYFNWTYFFVAHDKIYLIKWPKLFWEQVVNEKMKVERTEKFMFWDFEVDIKDKSLASQINLVWSILRFSQPKDVYKWKNLNKYLLNKKVPIFWRNFRPVFVVDGKIVKVW
jgi:hypothetical protein